MIERRLGIQRDAKRLPVNIFVAIILFSAALGFQSSNIVEARTEGSDALTEVQRAPLSSPLYVPAPSVSLSVPASIQIGQAFSFTVTFDNTDTVDVGYGPFIDLVLPATGADGFGAEIDDGITFLSASYLGSAISADQIHIFTFPDAGAGTGCVNHPLAVQPGGQPGRPELPLPYQICGDAGDQLVVIVLPFGSFVPTQPPVVLTINAQLSNLADLGTPLGIRAQAGFQFGATPTNDFCCPPFDATIPVVPGGIYDTTTWLPTNVTPSLMTLAKNYIGPEGETATGPNFPRQFEITVDIADGQTVTNLLIQDNLPGNIQFVSIDSVTPTDDPLLRALPSTSAPGGTLSVSIPSVTGGAGANDARLVFTYFVDRAVAGVPVLPPADGSPTVSSNTANANGTWMPIDVRDQAAPPPVTATCGVPCVSVQDQSVVVQKSVRNITDSTNSPGDVLEYTLNFQVSDFFGLQNIDFTDIISDGQHFQSTFTPTLSLNGNPNANSLTTAGMGTGNVDVSCNYTSGPGTECDSSDPTANDGRTTITFNLSDELADRFSNGQLLGGCVNPAQANNPPLCSGAGSYNDGPTQGTITFRTVIQQNFTDDYPSGDSSVDHGDILRNNVIVAGEVLNISTAPIGGSFPGTGNSPSDNSSASLSIAFGTLQKTLYAVNGSTTIPTYLSPGDLVTYRLQYTQPASDFETTVLTDFLPLPVFSATELTTLTNSPCGFPAAGQICLGPADTYHSLNDPPVNEPNPVVVSTFSVNGGANSVTITYPSYDSQLNRSSVIDLLFTVTLEADPFADGLFLTNQANALEGTTNAGDQELNGIVKIQIGEPSLRTAKTAVSTDHLPASDLTFAPNQPIYSQFSQPGLGGAPFSGVISTDALSSNPGDPELAFNQFNGSLTGVDGGDLVKYAILVENQGHSQNGAFDVVINDSLPPGMFIPTGGPALNLQVYRGEGTPLSFEVVDFGANGKYDPTDTAAPGDATNAFRIFDAGYGIRVVDGPDAGKGACQVHDATSGKNVLVFTYDLMVDNINTPGEAILNTSKLLGYSSNEGGSNFVDEPFTDTSLVMIGQPAISKTLTGTEVNNATNNNTQAVIGELATYTVTAIFHEGVLPLGKIVDTLGAGLAFVDVVSITVSNPDTDGAGNGDNGIYSDKMTFDGAGLCTNCTAGTTSGTSNPFIENNGNRINFDLGTVTDTNTDNNADETLTIVYRAVTLNVAGNQAGTTLKNSAVMSWDDSNPGTTDNLPAVSAANVTVIEPNVNINKTIAPATGDANDVVTYTIALTGATGTDAYEVTVSDTIPALILSPTISLVTDTASQVTAANFNFTGNVLSTATPFDMPVDATRTIAIQITGTIAGTVTGGQTIDNVATVQWTSLDGNVVDRSTYNTTDSDERTGTGGVNDYTKSNPATSARFTANSIVNTKYIIATSESHTSDAMLPYTGTSNPPRVAIGEIVRYRLIVQVPEGTFTNFQMSDVLPGGLTYLDDGTARVGFVSNGPGISSANFGALPVQGIPGGLPPAGCNATGNTANGSTPAGPLSCLLSDSNVGSSNSTSLDPDIYNSGTDPQFKLGTLTNADSDADAEFVVIEFNALVDNNGGAASNDGSETRDNNFGVTINGTPNGVQSGSARVTIAEPSIPFNAVTNNKTVTPTTGDAGDTVTYTVTYTNAGGVNNSDAFEVRITDALPADVTRISAVTPSYNAACQSATVTVTDASAGNSIDFTVNRARPGCQVTLTYTATLNISITSGQLLNNTARITYTSLPGGNGTASNPTGSSTPGASGTGTGERNGTGVNPPNDHNGSDSATVTVSAIAPVKSIVSTSAAHTSEAGNGSVGNERALAIGELVRYRLSVTLPEGTISDLQLRDTLPSGLTFLNDGDVRISFIANNAMSTEADLAGADNDVLPPTFVLPGGRIAVAGQDVTFTVASLVTPGNLVNNDTDADAEFVVIDFNVRVNNDANNNNADIDNNSFVLLVGGSTVATSNSVRTRIVEPVLNIAKTANDSTWLYGQIVTYTLNVTHDASSLADAFDVRVTDVIPTGLTYVPGSLTAPGGCTGNASAAPTLTWTCASFPLGSAASLSYQVTVNSPPGPPTPLLGNETAINTVNMNWSSLPGNTNPGNSIGERDGSGGVNDYFDSASFTGSLENYYSLGNRVWFDTNNNSLIDAGEVGVDNVVVNLYSASDLTTALKTDTTSGGGYYLFDYLVPGDYVVALAASNFANGAVLDTYWSSGTTLSGAGVISEAAAPDADITPTDSDDNGELQSTGVLTGTVASQAVTLGPAGLTEPTGETDLESGVGQGSQPDGRANMTVDFGFYRTGIGNLVWLESITADGQFSGEVPVQNATVRLYASNGTTEIPVGPDGALGTSDDAAGGVTTNASGIYGFSGLPQGDYIVRVVGPADTVSTTDVFNAADSANPTATNANDNDNGLGTVGNIVSSSVLTLTPGTMGALGNNTVDNASGTTTNPTLDFGFAYAYALGNRVWFDTNNNSQIDFANEVGVDGVTVELYAADGAGNPAGAALATDTTAGSGYYLFDNLFPGDYVVVLPASNFSGAGVLTGYWSSATMRALDGTITETTAADANIDVDSDDNGARQISGGFSNAVISSAVTLGPIGLTEPASESDLESGLGQGTQPDGRANMTVDFGFYRVAVGNLVFGDLNKNGTYDAGDTLLSNINLELYSADGSALIASTPTDAGGLYSFTGLPQGDYILRTTAPAGTASTIDSFDQADNDNPNTNTDNNDNGDGMANGIVSSAAISLTPGTVGAQSKNTISNATGTTTNPTMDFGFSLAYALGNRVWFDTNNDSQISPGEVGVDGVTVNLYSASDLATILATDITSGGGYYLFNNLDVGDYVVVIPASNFGGGLLEGYWSSGTTRSSNGSLTEAAAPDADANASDADDNGTLQNSGTFSGGVTAFTITLGPGGVEPVGEIDLEGGAGQGQPDAQANMTVDFGFYTITLGDFVWNDVNNTGTADGGDMAMPNADVQLWSSDLSTLLATDTTDGTGTYGFTGLPQGNYVLRIPAAEFNPGGTLRDYVSSTGGVGLPYEPAPSAETNTTDSDDNGTIANGTLGLGGYIQSSTFALTPAAEASVNNALGLTSEPRIDFGVYSSLQADLAITKTDSTTFYVPGRTLTYTITVTNHGPSDANGATVSDTLPAQISSWTWVCSDATGGATGCDGASGLTTDFSDTVDLPQLSSITYTVTANVAGDASGTLDNSAMVTAPGGVAETDATNNTATDSDEPASLQVSKDDGLLIVSAGSMVTYQIMVTNNGSVDLTNITVTDTLPTDLTYQSALPAPSNISGQVLTWSGLSLTAGSSMTISVTVKVADSPASAVITNSVSVGDSNTNASAADDDSDSIASNSDFTKTLVDSNHPGTTDPAGTIGEILTYELALNVPPGSMVNAQVVDTPQTGLAFVDLLSVKASDTDSDAAGAADTGLYSSIMAFDPVTGVCINCVDGITAGVSNPLIENSGSRVTFDPGTLTNSTAVPVTLTIRYSVVVLNISANQNGNTLVNNALWTWNGGSLHATSPTVKVVEPELFIDKNADILQAPYGAPITFTLEVAHTAASSAHAYDVAVTDVLPTGLTFIPGTLSFSGLAPTSSIYDPATFTLTFVWDEFQLGQTATITFQPTFVGPAPVVNETNVYWTSLPIDPVGGFPVVQSPYNPNSAERRYDPMDATALNNYDASDSVTITLPDLPETGFAPGELTDLPSQPDWYRYADLGDFWIEIPQLNLKLPVVGVPLDSADGWNLTWLGQQAGWLEGSAYPTHAGNSVITGHVYDANGQPGPFVNLNKLYWGHQIIVHLGSQKYIYEVREVRLVWPDDRKVFRHEEYPWLTLITCKDYDKNTKTYAQRVAVGAVLVKIVDE